MNVIGIDVSKAKLDCALLRDENKVKTKIFSNNGNGWKELIIWSQKNTGGAISGIYFVMEATEFIMKTSQHGYITRVQRYLWLILPMLNIMLKV